MNDQIIIQILASLLVIFFAIGLHEYAHAKVADLAGDPTPRAMGRVTLNLFKHFDPLGTVMIIVTSITGFGIGWGKPVIVNPQKMKNPRWDGFMSVLAGPLTNVILAMFFAIVLQTLLVVDPRILVTSPFIFDFLRLGVLINLSLAMFNLIPFGPLDGHWLVGYLLPEKVRYNWFMFNRSAGFMLLIIIIFAGQITGFSIIGALIGAPVKFLYELFTGLKL